MKLERWEWPYLIGIIVSLMGAAACITFAVLFYRHMGQ